MTEEGRDKIQSIINDIRENYPELLVQSHQRDNNEFHEMIKTYYQIKQLEFQKEQSEFQKKFQEDQSKFNKKEKIISIVLTLIIAGSTIINVYLTTTNNKTMQDLYLVPKEPTLRIWSNTHNYFSQQELSRVGDRASVMNLCFYNEGRAPTGHIHANIDLYDKYFSSDDLNIENIEGGKVNCTIIHVINDAVKFGKTDYNASIEAQKSLPTGNYTLKFDVTCDNCISKTFEVAETTICIWGDEYSYENCEWAQSPIIKQKP